MTQDPVFTRVSDALLDYLREELVPIVLSSPDLVKLGHPGQEEDYRLGICLHDMEEVRPNGPPGMTRLSEGSRRLPDLALALHFMAFANRKVAFNSMEAADELLLLEAVLRAVHGTSGLEADGRLLKVGLHPLTSAEKLSLWQGMNTPLQPAVYITVEPIVVPSTRIARVPPVREVEIHTARKVERRPRSP